MMNRLTKRAAAVFMAFQAFDVLLAGDPVSWAVDGSLWEKSSAEVERSIFSKTFHRWVDEQSLRYKKSEYVKMGDVQLGDVVMKVTEDKKHFTSFHTTIYNKGDDGDMDKEQFESLLSESLTQLKDKLGSEGVARQQSRKETGLKTRAWEWQNDHCAVLLESATTGKGKKYVSEFIRLSIAPTKEALEKGGAKDVARRSDLKENVVTEENGDVWIKGVPMVDQGEKGYCVPAAVSRVFAYYGMDGVDQHALAALCKSSDQGTTLNDMDKALRDICGPFHMTVKSWDWVNMKSFLKKARKMVRKTGVMLDDHEIAGLILEDVEKHPGNMNKGLGDIKQQIDVGIPVVWAVVLGIFPEQGLPQSVGGHMRLIIGYNEQKRTIIYTDSWGIRHTKKALPMKQACAMTHRLWVLRPAM